MGKMTPLYKIIEAEKKAKIVSIFGNKNEIKNTIITGKTEYNL